MTSKFLRDGSALLAGEMVSRVFVFGTTLVVARGYGLEAVAVLSLAQSLIGYATVAGNSGLGNYAVRKIIGGAPVEPVTRQTARTGLLHG